MEARVVSFCQIGGPESSHSRGTMVAREKSNRGNCCIICRARCSVNRAIVGFDRPLAGCQRPHVRHTRFERDGHANDNRGTRKGTAAAVRLNYELSPPGLYTETHDFIRDTIVADNLTRTKSRLPPLPLKEQFDCFTVSPLFFVVSSFSLLSRVILSQSNSWISRFRKSFAVYRSMDLPAVISEGNGSGHIAFVRFPA